MINSVDDWTCLNNAGLTWKQCTEDASMFTFVHGRQLTDLVFGPKIDIFISSWKIF